MRLCERTENSNDKQNESSYMAMINRIDELKMDKEHATDLSENTIMRVKNHVKYRRKYD